MQNLTPEQSAAIQRAQERRLASETDQPTRSSSIFPISRYGDDYRLDFNAGITGAIGRAIRAPGEAMRGELQVTDGQGNITDEAIGRSLEFAGVVVPANPALRAGERAIPGAAGSLHRPDVPPPTREQLRATGARQYDEFRGTDVTYPQSDIQRMSQEAAADLSQGGFNRRNAPQTFGVFDDVAAIPPGGIVSPNEIQSMRQALGRAAAPNVQYPADAAAASQALSRFDDFVKTYGQPSSPAYRRASQSLEDANGNWGAMRRSDTITGVEDAAHLRSSAANSGLNSGNTIRQRVASALISGRPLRGFSAEERAALRQIVEGTLAQNTTRDAASLLGGGGGLGGITAAGIGGAAGASVAGPGGAIGGAIGVGLTGRLMRVISNRLTENALRRADEQIRRRSPLYQRILRETPMEGRSPEQRMMLVRAMLALELSPANAGSGSVEYAPRLQN